VGALIDIHMDLHIVTATEGWVYICGFHEEMERIMQ
jgi:hypothetical protein